MSAIALLGIASLAFALGLQMWLCYRLIVRLTLIDRRLDPWRSRAGVLGPLGSDDAHRRRRVSGLGAVGAPLAQALASFAPVGPKERDKLTNRLRAAGYGGPNALAVLLCCKLLSAVGLFITVILLTRSSDMVVFLSVLFSLAGAALGGLLPEYALSALAARRGSALSSSLCDALDLMVMGIETGASPDHTLAQVVHELSPVAPALCAELGQLEAELRIGADREQALTAFVRRSDVDGLRDLGMALIQGGRYGTPLSESLRNLAQSERHLRATRVSERIERLPVIMALPMTALIVPGAALLIVGPGILTALDAMSGFTAGGVTSGLEGD